MNDSCNSINNNAVFRWLQDLRFMSENECLCVLQAKSLSNKFKSNGTTTTSMNKIRNNNNNNNNNNQQSSDESNNEMDLLDFFIKQYELINDQINFVLNKLYKNSLPINMNIMIQKLIDLIDSSLKIYFKLKKKYCSKPRFSYYLLKNLTPNAITVPFYSVLDNQNAFKDIEDKLVTNLNTIRNNSFNSIDIKESLKRIDDNYKIFNEKSIRFSIEIQLAKLYNKESLTNLTVILNQILEICLKNEPVKKIFIELNGILIFFNTLKDSYFKNILELILRTLSVLCSSYESLNSLKQIDCFGILTDILCDETAPEWTRTEAAGCIAQIASPSLDFCTNLSGFLENIQDLTRALTVLCRDSGDIEIFLIGIAALANLTFIDNVSCECFRQFSTAQVLIENFYLKNYNSIFVKDQITTILANMALLENCRSEIFEFNGLNLLVDFLFETPNEYEANETELTACERVLQKAAIAISRFSKETKYSQIFLELEVVQRLTILCQNPDDRNNNDSIFIACLSALKAISATCDSDIIFKDKEIKKLLKLKSIKDSSLLQCSSTTEESYV